MNISSIKSIKKIKYDKKVYDISLDEDHLFYANLGSSKNRNLLIHNSLPDIDLDVESSSDEKTDVYFYERYGKERVFPVITFSTFNEKGCLKDVVKAFGFDAGFESDVMAVTKEMPKMFAKYEGNLSNWIEDYPNTPECSPRVKKWLTNPENKEILDITLGMQGQARNLGKHAAGLVITPGPVWECMPINVVKGTRVSGFQESGSGKDLSTLGILKLDRLNLTTLNVLKSTVELIRESKGIDVYDKIKFIDLENPELFEELRGGNNQGVFQFESDGMSKLIKDMHTENFEEMVAANALYRPGPMGVGAHEEFIRNKKYPEETKLVHPLLEPLLKATNGVLIFQEQLMFIANELAGMSLGDGDALRKVMDKSSKIIKKKLSGEPLLEKEEKDKNYKEYVELWEQFKTGCRSKGMSEDEVRDVEEWLVKYLGYSFNKCLSENHIIESKNRGKIPILSVDINEEILCYNPKTKENEFNKVKDIHKNGIKEVYKILTKTGKVIECTKDHKIMTEEGMKTLQFIIDNKIKILVSGNFENILNCELIGKVDTYDLEIDSEFHNFYANDVCVSNSHSVSYTYIAMQTLYMKRYYPTEFYTSLLNNAKDDKDWLCACIMGAFSKGIKVVPPKRQSKWEWSMLDDTTIMMGYSSINGMGEVAYNQLQESEISNISKEKFFVYPYSKFNKGNFQACLSAGIFDDWSDSRDEMIELRKMKMKKSTMQLDLFGGNSFGIFQESIKDKFEKTSQEQKYDDFIKVCTLDLELFNKISNIKTNFQKQYNFNIEPVTSYESPDKYYYFVLKDIIERFTKNNRPFWTLELSDGAASVKITVWQDAFDRISDKLKKGSMYLTKFTKDGNWLKFQDGAQFKEI